MVHAPDLFGDDAASRAYDASAIEVLEGLEPVRKRPGMYVGGTDERALHHLVAEVLDNAMDEAVAGHANRIEVELHADFSLTVRDNGRGMPVDPHPRFPGKSALEVILCTLHAGGKFSGKAYQTSRRPARRRRLGGQRALRPRRGRGRPQPPALAAGVLPRPSRRGRCRRSGRRRTAAAPPSPSTPTPRSSAPRRTLQAGAAATAWSAPRPTSSPASRSAGAATPPASPPATTRPSRRPSTSPAASPTTSPSGSTARSATPTSPSPARSTSPSASAPAPSARSSGRSTGRRSATPSSPPTATPSTPPRAAPTRRASGRRSSRASAPTASSASNRKAAQITREDVMAGGSAMISVFIREPEFVGQTKDRLATQEAARLVESAVRDRFDHWLAADTRTAGAILDYLVLKAEERLRRRAEKETQPQDRGEEAAPARQARRLLGRHPRGLGALPRRGRLGRRLGQAGARPQDPGGAAAPRQDPERARRRLVEADAEPGARRPRAGDGGADRLALRRRRPALREDHHHDRRRRRRRAHRLAPDDLLLHPDAAADRRTATSTSPRRRSTG